MNAYDPGVTGQQLARPTLFGDGVGATACATAWADYLCNQLPGVIALGASRADVRDALAPLLNDLVADERRRATTLPPARWLLQLSPVQAFLSAVILLCAGPIILTVMFN